MPLIRAGVEAALRLLLGTARGVFILQALAFGCAGTVGLAAAPSDSPDWLRSAAVSALLVSATFFLAGMLLVAEGRWHGYATRGAEPAWPWRAVLGASLVVLPAVAAAAASALPALWSDIAAQLRAAGVWEAVTRADPFAGIVLLPIFVALLVPLLVTATALWSAAFPLCLLVLLGVRSAQLPTLLRRGAICQAGLAIAAWIAVAGLERLAAPAVAAMIASGDTAVAALAGQLEIATTVLDRSAAALALPAVGMLAWLGFLRPSTAAAHSFTAQGITGDAPPARSMPERTPPSIPHVPAPERTAPAGRATLARRGLATLGAVMLAFSVLQGLRTRAAYVASQPAPGATLPTPPVSVRVTFGAELDAASTISVTRLSAQPDAGDGPRDMPVTKRLATDDPGGRTIEAVPPRLGAGLYRVAWQALPAGGGVPRHGSFSFGVGVSVPGGTDSLEERDSGARARRQTILGGIILLALAAVLPTALRAGYPRPSGEW